MIPLSVPNIDSIDIEAVTSEMGAGWVSTAGPSVKVFEQELRDYFGGGEVCLTNSGTSALHLAFLASGITPDCEVICGDVSFIATANAIKYCRAYPVFIRGKDFNLSADSVEKFLQESTETVEFEGSMVTINKKSGRKIHAICAVHVWGNPADLNGLKQIADEHGLQLIEDAAEAFGSSSEDGPIGHSRTIAAFSFNGNKLITTGSGGCVVSSNTEVIERARYLARQAKNPSSFFDHSDIGFNYSMNAMSAALGRSQLAKLKEILEKKQHIRDEYERNLESSMFTLNRTNEFGISNNWLNLVKVPGDIMKIIDAARAEGIEMRPVWPYMSDQKPYKNHETFFDTSPSFDIQNWICIPSSYRLTDGQISNVTDLLKRFSD